MRPARFTAGETLIFEITYGDALPAGVSQFTALDFNFHTEPDNDGSPTFPAIAHIQSIGDEDLSTWVVPGLGTGGGPVNVPEPTQAIALGALLVAGLLVSRRRRS
jgi:hypothetical protein